MSELWQLIKVAALRWWEHQCMRLGAAVAFYSMLSLAPLVVLVIAVASLIFGEEATRGRLVEQMRDLAGKQGAEVIEQLLANAHEQPSAGVLATVLGGIMLLLGATGVFVELQDSLNLIWDVPRKVSGTWWAMIRGRFLSFSMVLGVAFLLIVSLVVSAALAALSHFAGGWESSLASVLRVAHLLLSVALLGVLFAVLLKFLPDTRVGWGEAFFGGMFTAALFSIGKYLIGLYLGGSGFGSAYGAAGSFAVFFVWMYYSAQIFFFGAEFTRAYSERFGTRARREIAEAEGQRELIEI